MNPVYKVTGDCVQFFREGEDQPLLAWPVTSPQDDFLEFMRLLPKDLFESGAWAEFSVDNGRLYVTVAYTAKRRLTAREQDVLKDHTVGQWSDGIGEFFEQVPSATDDHGREVYTSLWHRNQITKVEE